MVFPAFLAALGPMLAKAGAGALAAGQGVGAGALGAGKALGAGALGAGKTAGAGLIGGGKALGSSLLPGGATPLQGMATAGKEMGSGLIGGGKGLMTGVTDAVSAFNPSAAQAPATSIGNLGTMADSASPAALPPAAQSMGMGPMQKASQVSAERLFGDTLGSAAAGGGTTNKTSADLFGGGGVGKAVGALFDLGTFGMAPLASSMGLFGSKGSDEAKKQARAAKKYKEDVDDHRVASSAGAIMAGDAGGPLLRAATVGSTPKPPKILGGPDDGDRTAQMLSAFNAMGDSARVAEHGRKAGEGLGTLYDMMRRRSGRI